MLTAISTVYDREFGMLRLMLASPAGAPAILAGRAIAAAAVGILQGGVVLLCIPLILSVTAVQLAAAVAALALGAAVSGVLGLLVAAPLRSVENFAGIINVVLFPLLFLSGALYPTAEMPMPLRVVAAAQSGELRRRSHAEGARPADRVRHHALASRARRHDRARVRPDGCHLRPGAAVHFPAAARQVRSPQVRPRRRQDVRRLVIGCGYLGERVARLWRGAGDEVYATTRGQRADALAEAGLRPLTLDVTAEPPAVALPVVDTIVFAVGRDRQSGATMADIHVKGLRAVLDALPAPTGRVIYVSSTGVYGQDDGEWVDEESACEPAHDGGRACLSGERILFDHPRGRDAIALRLAGLYGPGRVPLSTDVAAGRPIAGSPDAYLNLIHVADAASAVVAAAASRPGTGPIYVVSDGHPAPRGEYVQHLATRLGAAPARFEGGSGLGKRARNARAIRELGLRLTYPSYREGLAAL